VLVDYKTDRIEGPDERISKILNERYKTQMSIYAQAIEQTTGRTVKESIIWLVGAEKAFNIEMDIKEG